MSEMSEMSEMSDLSITPFTDADFVATPTADTVRFYGFTDAPGLLRVIEDAANFEMAYLDRERGWIVSWDVGGTILHERGLIHVPVDEAADRTDGRHLDRAVGKLPPSAPTDDPFEW